MGPTPLSPLPTAPHASPAPRSGALAARPKLRREDLGGERGRGGGGRGLEGPPLRLVSPAGAGDGGGQRGGDLLWRRSGIAAVAVALNGLEKSERMAEVDLRPGAAAVAAEASSPARRSRRQAAQKPVKVSSGWRSHVVDTDRRGGGTGGSICSTIYLGRPRTAG